MSKTACTRVIVEELPSGFECRFSIPKYHVSTSKDRVFYEKDQQLLADISLVEGVRGLRVDENGQLIVKFCVSPEMRLNAMNTVAGMLAYHFERQTPSIHMLQLAA